jgi:hypothetical protein
MTIDELKEQARLLRQIVVVTVNNYAHTRFTIESREAYLNASWKLIKAWERKNGL